MKEPSMHVLAQISLKAMPNERTSHKRLCVMQFCVYEMPRNVKVAKTCGKSILKMV